MHRIGYLQDDLASRWQGSAKRFFRESAGIRVKAAIAKDPYILVLPQGRLYDLPAGRSKM
jgi:hypothetical protein